MAASELARRRGRSGSITLSTDPKETNGHFSGLEPQTPFGSISPSSSRSNSPVSRRGSEFTSRSKRIVAPSGLWHDIKTMRWAVEPLSAFKLLMVPIILYVNWEIVAPFAGNVKMSNPFEPLLFLSGYISTSTPDDPRYRKTYKDLAFVAYHIIFFAFVRQIITINICRPIARYFGLRKLSKQERFGEQAYALVYFAVFGAWGFRNMSQLPTWWYRTEYFWIDYPHWNMEPELKRYYLMQSAYWCHQFIVLVLKLEKPRKDYYELIGHHIVTLWLVFWSYLFNMTLIGNAVYMSMDIPDACLALSKLLNYIQWERAKVVAFGVLLFAWSYFRHWCNLRMLWSAWYEYDMIPEHAKQWNPPDGVWLVWWIKYQVFAWIAALQALNLFWYYLIWRILFRSLRTSVVDDDRSDDEDGTDVVEGDSKEE